MPRQNVRLRLRITEEDGSYWATVDEMPGVFAAGETFGELLDSVVNGVALWLAEPDGPVPTVTIGDMEKVGREATAELIYA